jgi:hypothetical protein
MTTAVQTPVQSEYRNLPLESLTESPLNPRLTFDDAALQELAESIRTQGVLSPLLVRPKGPQTYEIVTGARRYRAAQLAAIGYVPVRIAELSDAQALEMSIVENLQRRDVHPLEEAQGFAALLRLEEPARVRGFEDSPDRIGSGSGRSICQRRDRRRPCASAGKTPTGAAGGSPCRLLAGGLRERQQIETDSAPRSPPPRMDRAQHSAGAYRRAVLER